ncbi:MAG: YafY family transcriptional regulator [Bauldia sp.]|nr:YafY family transcriptional regulator [Bauldia sp.]
MARTERLFSLMDALRRHRRPVTAADLSADLGVSVRTIYRDIQVLTGLGAPIDGEAGLGYLLRPGFFLPPLMFDEAELEALVLGVRFVGRQGDESLAAAASNALAKIAAAAPADLRDAIAATGLWAPPRWTPDPDRHLLAPLREAIRRELKIRIVYTDEKGAETTRLIWPIALSFYDDRRTIAAWCELRSGFRHFRTDRIGDLAPTGERYPRRRALLVADWRRENKLPRGE